MARAARAIGREGMIKDRYIAPRVTLAGRCHPALRIE
jgi:hypothetical protein